MADGDVSTNEKIAITIVSGCFAIASALIPVVDGWRQRRDLSQRATRELDLATKQIGFWKSILDVYPNEEDAKARNAVKSVVTSNILRVAAKQEFELILQLEAHVPILPRPLRDRIFLIYQPRSPLAWLPRALMYFTLGAFIYIVHNDKPHDFRDPLVIALFFASLGAVFIFRFLAEQLGAPKRRF